MRRRCTTCGRCGPACPCQTDRALVERLLRGALEPSKYRGVLDLGDGWTAELHITISRRASAQDEAAYREQAIAELRRWRTIRCSLSTRKKFLRRAQTCHQDVVAAVVMKSDFGGGLVFRFVCVNHRRHHGIDLAHVLAVVNLPAAELRAIRAEIERPRATEPSTPKDAAPGAAKVAP